MRNLPKSVEPIFTVLSLFLYSGALLPLVLSGGISQGDGQEAPSSYPLIQFIFLIVYFITALLLVKRWKQIISLLIKEKFIFLLISLAFISAFWSDFPLMTIKRSIALAGTTLFAIYFSTRYTFKQQLQLLSVTLGITIFLSFIFITAFPEYGIMKGVHNGIWRGIYLHKNTLGQMMGLSSLLFLSLALDKRKKCFSLWMGFGFSVFLIIFSTSKTALLVSIIILIICGLYTFYFKKYIVAIASIAAIFLISGSLFLQIQLNLFAPIVLSDMVSAITGTISNEETVSEQSSTVPDKSIITEQSPTVSSDDIKTFTGRKQLWFSVSNMIKKRPWLGYGYGSFWLGNKGPSTQVWNEINWPAPHAHNGLLDLWLELGIIGVLVFLSGLLYTSLKIIKGLFANNKLQETKYFFYLIYIMFWISINVTSSNLLKHNSLFWVAYVAIVSSLSLSDERVKTYLP